MKTLFVGGLLLSGAALAQNPDPIVWIAPPFLLALEDGANIEPDAVAVGDLTGDGLADLIFVDRRTGGLQLLTNAMGGHGWPSQGTPLDLTSRDGQVAIADVDGDGDQDYIALSLEGDGAVIIGLQQADGGFARAVIAFDAGDPIVSSHGLSVGDVNGDGIDDIALNDPTHHVVYRQGDGWASARLTDFPAFDQTVQFGDVDGDGDLDAIGRVGADPILLRNDGQLPWPARSDPSWRLGDAHYAFADVLPAGDGAELISATPQRLHIAPNRAATTFGPWAQSPHDAMAEAVAVDVDRDGDLDLVGAARDDPYNLLLLESDGAGSFRQQRRVNGRGNRDDYFGRIWPGDLNGDGVEDVVASYDDGQLFIYALGSGVLGALYTPRPQPLTIAANDRRRRRDGTIRVSPLVDLPQPVQLVEVTVRVDTPSPADVLEAIEIVSQADGSPVVGRIEGDALQAVTRVPLAGEGLRVTDAEVRLDVFFINRPDAHHATDAVRIAWRSVDARFADDAPAPVANQLVQARTWMLPNRAPVAQADAFEVPEGGAAALDVLANDADPDGDPLTVEIVDPPNAGALEIVDGQPRYTHDGREAPRIDGFTYRVRDPRGDASDVVAVALTIAPTNDPPVGQPDAYVTREDVPLVMEADLGLLFNDLDPDGDLLSAILDTPPAQGALQLEPDGRFVYLPAPDMHGEVTFTYRPDDGTTLGEPVVVTLTILPDADPPRPAGGPFQTTPATPIVLQLGGVDPEGDATVLLIEGFPDRGHLVALRSAQGVVTYVPPEGYVGQARFSYRLTDRSLVSDLFEAVIQVAP